MSRIRVDLKGIRFGRLVAVKPLKPNSSGNIVWLCVCDCGKKIKANSGALRYGKCASCGCSRVDGPGRQNAIKLITKHGHATTGKGKTPSLTYRSWTAMNTRCYNPNGDRNVVAYSGRGIRVCKRWRKGTKDAFRNFLKDMGERPSKDYSIDRIDNNGDYTKSNCRWATRSQQQKNKRPYKKRRKQG